MSCNLVFVVDVIAVIGAMVSGVWLVTTLKKKEWGNSALFGALAFFNLVVFMMPWPAEIMTRCF